MARGRKPKTTKETIDSIMNTEEEVVEIEEEKEVEKVEEEKPKTVKKTTRKTTTKKTQPKKTVKKNTKKMFDRNDEVLVKSLVNGRLGYENDRTGHSEMWNEFGEELYMPYGELQSIRSKHRRFFEDNWIICEWEVLEALGVTKFYKNIVDVENLEDMFKDKSEFKGILEKLPKGLRQIVIDKATEMKLSGELDSLQIIRDIKDVTGFDLSLVGEEG